MHSLGAILFPETRPSSGLIASLATLFDRLVLAQAVEGSPGPPLPGCLGERVRLWCPVPLGAQRDRFLSLLNELRARRDDYAGQLGRLSIASLGGGLAGESSVSILGGLREAAPAELRERLLWQARLVLCLAEIQAEEEEELRRELERINAQRRAMLAELREEGKDTSLLPAEEEVMSPPPDRSPHLLKAWSRLYAAGVPAQDIPSVLVTANALGAESLLDEAARVLGSRPAPCCRIPLPAPQAEPGQYWKDSLAALHGNAAALRAALAADQDPAPEAIDAWARALNQHFPGPGTTFTWYRFKGIPPSRLLLEAFGRQEDLELFPCQDAPPLRLAVLELPPSGERTF